MEIQIKYKNGIAGYETENGIFEMRRILVSEESRHTGIGTELLNQLIEIASGLGFDKIVTFSSTDPEREVFGKFLVAEGFIKTNEANNIGDRWELTTKIKVPVKEKVKNVVEKVKINKKK